MPSYALISTNPSSPPTHMGGGGGTESTEGVGWQEPPSASNAVGGATETRIEWCGEDREMIERNNFFYCVEKRRVAPLSDTLDTDSRQKKQERIRSV